MKRDKDDLDLLLEEDEDNPRFQILWNIYETADQLSDEVARLRQRSGMTQTDLARKMKTCQEVISRIENSKRPVSLKTLQRVAAAFGKRLEIRFV